jgi:hypothetical protein
MNASPISTDELLKTLNRHGRYSYTTTEDQKRVFQALRNNVQKIKPRLTRNLTIKTAIEDDTLHITVEHISDEELAAAGPKTRKAKPIPNTPGEFEVGDIVIHTSPVPEYAKGDFRVIAISTNKKGEREASCYGGEHFRGGQRSGNSRLAEGQFRTFYVDRLVKV